MSNYLKFSSSSLHLQCIKEFSSGHKLASSLDCYLHFIVDHDTSRKNLKVRPSKKKLGFPLTAMKKLGSAGREKVPDWPKIGSVGLVETQKFFSSALLKTFFVNFSTLL